MNTSIKAAADAIQSECGPDAVKQACLYIIERGMLGIDENQYVTRFPASPAMWAARLCAAANEDSEALMQAIVELVSEKDDPAVVHERP